MLSMTPFTAIPNIIPVHAMIPTRPKNMAMLLPVATTMPNTIAAEASAMAAMIHTQTIAVFLIDDALLAANSFIYSVLFVILLNISNV